jgi:hypothetical protein
MAETEQEQSRTDEGNGHADGGARKAVVRAAALAAASGATAFAAKKAFSDREPSAKKRDATSDSGKGQDESVFTTMASSAWNSARGTLVPMIEDAAGQAGEFMAQNGPEVVRENIIPRFIRGFERGRKSASSD